MNARTLEEHGWPCPTAEEMARVDRAAIERLFQSTHFELIIHCAAQPSHDLAPIPGEMAIVGPPPPPPRFVGRVQQHLAGPHVLPQDHRQPPPATIGTRRIFGKHLRAGFGVFDFQQPGHGR